MHRKFRQNSSDLLKDFAIGNSCTCLTGQASVDDQHCYSKANYGKQCQKEQLRKSFGGVESAKGEEEEEYEDESVSELFHGFLAIGTLGNDPISTPTFAISVDNITERETEVTESELKLINDELEKVLGGEGQDHEYSSGRNSHVSTGRSSHGSSITLSGKAMEGGVESTVCPLQGYLFGSAIELSETTASVAKKEHRTSLGELFQRTKIAEDHNSGSGGKWDKEEKRATDKEADKSAVHIMKKMLKKKMLQASRTSTNDSASQETKLHKILQMFHRKVHPESSTSLQKHGKAGNNKKNMWLDGANDVVARQMLLQDEDVATLPTRIISKEPIRRNKSQSNPSQFTLTTTDSNGNREYWIRTDADYLVLEL